MIPRIPKRVSGTSFVMVASMVLSQMTYCCSQEPFVPTEFPADLFDGYIDLTIVPDQAQVDFPDMIYAIVEIRNATDRSVYMPRLDQGFRIEISSGNASYEYVSPAYHPPSAFLFAPGAISATAVAIPYGTEKNIEQLLTHHHLKLVLQDLVISKETEANIPRNQPRVGLGTKGLQLVNLRSEASVTVTNSSRFLRGESASEALLSYPPLWLSEQAKGKMINHLILTPGAFKGRERWRTYYLANLQQVPVLRVLPGQVFTMNASVREDSATWRRLQLIEIFRTTNRCKLDRVAMTEVFNQCIALLETCGVAEFIRNERILTDEFVNWKGFAELNGGIKLTNRNEEPVALWQDMRSNAFPGVFLNTEKSETAIERTKWIDGIHLEKLRLLLGKAEPSAEQ